MEGGCAGNDAVEIARIALGSDEAFTAAVGATTKVGVLGKTAVVAKNDFPGGSGDELSGTVLVIGAGGRIGTEGAVKAMGGGVGGVACIGGDDGVTAEEGGTVAETAKADGGLENAVEAATALEEEAAVPIGGEAEFEDVAVRFAIAAGVFVDFAAEETMGGEGDLLRRELGSGGDGFRSEDEEAGDLKGFESFAVGRWGSGESNDAEEGEQIFGH
jgi:hypothetical protein